MLLFQEHQGEGAAKIGVSYIVHFLFSLSCYKAIYISRLKVTADVLFDVDYTK